MFIVTQTSNIEQLHLVCLPMHTYASWTSGAIRSSGETPHHLEQAEKAKAIATHG